MTEEEAKSSPCPLSFQRGERGTINANAHGFIMRCIGSACRMAWRWEQEKNQPALLDWAKGDMNDPAPDQFRTSATLGYCGLAGKP